MKKLVTAICLTMIMMVGNTFANGGLVLGDLAGGDQQDPCTSSQNGKGWINNGKGSTSGDFTGIIVNGFTGIIVNGATDTPTVVNCGVMLAD